MQTLNKQALFNHLADYGIEPDQIETAMIGKVTDGWSKRRPIKLGEISDENDANLIIASERHYMKEVGGGSKACTSYKCRETVRYSGEKMPFMDVKVTRIILDQTGVSEHVENCEDNTPSIKKAMEVDHEKERTFKPLNDITSAIRQGYLSLSECTAAVKTLRESIIKTLDDCGLFWDSLITDKEKNEEFTAKLDSILARAERRRRIDAFRQLAQRIDPEITAILEITGIKTPHAYNWLCADGNETISQNRKDAARRYPLLMNVLTGAHFQANYSRFHNQYFMMSMLSLDGSYHEKRRKEQEIADNFRAGFDTLKAQIDAGEDILDALTMSIYKDKALSPHTIVALEMCDQVPPSFDFNDFAKSLKYMDQLEPAQMPQNPDDLMNFIECYKRASKLSSIIDRPVEDILAEAEGNWLHFLSVTNSMDSIKAVQQWVNDIHQYIVIPQWLRHLQPETRVKISTESNFADYENDRTYSNYGDVIKKLKTPAPDTFLTGVKATDIIPYAISWQNNREYILKTMEELKYEPDRELKWESAAPKAEITDDDSTFEVTVLDNFADLKDALEEAGKIKTDSKYFFDYMLDAAKVKRTYIRISKTGSDSETLGVAELKEDTDYRGKFSNLRVSNTYSEKRLTKLLTEVVARKYAADVLDQYKANRHVHNQNANSAASAIIARMALSEIAGVDMHSGKNVRAAFQAMSQFLPHAIGKTDIDERFAAFHQTGAFDVSQSAFFASLVEYKLESKDRSHAPEWPPEN